MISNYQLTVQDGIVVVSPQTDPQARMDMEAVVAALIDSGQLPEGTVLQIKGPVVMDPVDPAITDLLPNLLGPYAYTVGHWVGQTIVWVLAARELLSYRQVQIYNAHLGQYVNAIDL